MYQRVVSLILLPFLLLTQSAVLGHSHGGGQPDGHGNRAHFHFGFSLAAHSHEHGHHHVCSEAHHHHDDQCDAGELPNRFLPEQDHDADAIFVDGTDITIGQRVSLDEELARASALIIQWLTCSACGDSDLQHSVLIGPPNRPPDGYSCALYIRHLALLI